VKQVMMDKALKRMAQSLVSCVLLSAAVLPVTSANTPDEAKAHAFASAWQMPAFFEKNQGQTSEHVLFQSRTSDYLALIAEDGFRVVPKAEQSIGVDFHFLGMNNQSSIKGEQHLPGKVNYFIGNNPDIWQRNIATFQQLRQRDVYPGIDLVYRFNQQGELEYDFEVAAGASVPPLVVAVSGADQMSLTADGALELQTPAGPLVHQAPVVYQQRDGQRHLVAAKYRLLGDQQVAIDLAAYDDKHALVIDPVLSYSTYLGGDALDTAHGIAWYEADNSIYVTGGTATQVTIKVDNTYVARSSGLSTTNGVHQTASAAATDSFDCAFEYEAQFGGASTQQRFTYDAFLAKIDMDTGALVFATYYGGCANDQSRDVALDEAGNAYIVGTTRSNDLARNGVQTSPIPGGDAETNVYPNDAFVAKFDDTGNLIYGRFIGGSDNDYGRAIDVDTAGRAYIVGNTQSSDLGSDGHSYGCFGRVDLNATSPESCYGGATDAFVARVSINGTTAQYGAYIGGRRGDWAADIVVEKVPNNIAIYVAGMTASPDFPLSTDKEPYKRYKEGAACSLTGTDFVADKHDCQDAFVVKLEEQGTKLVYSTMIGGNGDDTATAIAVTNNRDIYLAGITNSPGVYVDEFIGQAGRWDNDEDSELYAGFPLYNTAWDTRGEPSEYSLHNGLATKAFLVKFDETASYQEIEFSTFIGGSDGDKAVSLLVSESNITKDDNSEYIQYDIFLAGQTRSDDFFPLHNAFKTVADGEDIFVVKMIHHDELTNKSDLNLQVNPKVDYGTLFGAEGLDFPKGIAATTDANGVTGLYIAGASSSNRFPTSTDALHPSKQGGYSDGFVSYFQESSVVTDLEVTSAGIVLAERVGEQADFAFQVENTSLEVKAVDVRLSIDLPPGVTLTDRPSNCFLENKRTLYCTLSSDLDVTGGGGVTTESVSFSFIPRLGGQLQVLASVHSAVADSDLSNNSVIVKMQVAGNETSSSVSAWFLALLSAFVLIARYRSKGLKAV
jgi:hypothetical protein